MTGVEPFLAAQPAWAWVGLAAVLLVAELSTGSGYLLWPAASAAVVAGVLFLFPTWPVGLQVVVFLALTLVSTLTARRYLPRRLSGEGLADDLSNAKQRLVGHEGEAAAAERVFVDGKEWAAATEDGAPLPVGARVRVLAVLGGARLKVRPV